MNKNIKAFTLIEVLISITIFSIIMVSVISIYIANIDVNNKSNINRVLHENMRNVFTELNEEVLKNGISWVSLDLTDSDCNIDSRVLFSTWTKFCSNVNDYYLAKKNWDNYIRVNISECESIKDECSLVKNSTPITNSLVWVRNISFYVTENSGVKKLTYTITLQPSLKLWVKPNLIEKSKFTFQTTITQRPF